MTANRGDATFNEPPGFRTPTTTRYERFASVFRRNPSSTFEEGIARIAVLYEDLRVEVLGIAQAAPPVDVLGPDYRQLYFMRRAIATAREFQSALATLANTTEFKNIAARATELHDEDCQNKWLAAMNFFRSNRGILRSIRNDVGGHFGEEAIVHASLELTPIM